MKKDRNRQIGTRGTGICLETCGIKAPAALQRRDPKTAEMWFCAQEIICT